MGMIEAGPLPTGADPEHVRSGNRHARGFEDLVEVTTMIAGLAAARGMSEALQKVQP